MEQLIFFGSVFLFARWIAKRATIHYTLKEQDTQLRTQVKHTFPDFDVDAHLEEK